MIFVRLTRPDGKPLFVSTNGWTVEEVMRGESTPTARTRIMIEGVLRFVEESPDRVLEVLSSLCADD